MRNRTSTAIASLIVTAALALGACGSSSKKNATSPATFVPTTFASTSETTAPETTTVASTAASGPSTTAGTSVAQQAAYIHKVDPSAKTITFDPIVYLSGDAATRAYKADHPTAVDGPPNDYYVQNPSPTTVTLPVAADANLHHLADPGNPDSNATATLAALAADPLLPHEVFILTIGNGKVIATRQQFTP